VHDEEKILGNDYEVNAEIHFNEEQAEIHSLSQTINYADVFTIIKTRMQTPSPLLETVVMDIGKQIHLEYNYVRSINISLKKIHPPINDMMGSVAVTWYKVF
jgi:dihydroneopterin aldolase